MGTQGFGCGIKPAGELSRPFGTMIHDLEPGVDDRASFMSPLAGLSGPACT